MCHTKLSLHVNKIIINQLFFRKIIIINDLFFVIHLAFTIIIIIVVVVVVINNNNNYYNFHNCYRSLSKWSCFNSEF